MDGGGGDTFDRANGVSSHYPHFCGSSRQKLWDQATFPAVGRPAHHASQAVREFQLLDFAPQLNTSSYVNVLQDEDEESLILLGSRVNLADQTIYPGTFEVHNAAVAMVADLWHCPTPAGKAAFPGAQTVGSTEACLLAGLALKFRWRAWYSARHGLTPAETRGAAPNLVISTCFQACWEKLFRYLDVEPRFVTPSVDTMTVDAADVVAACDEHTMGVVCILGNHYGGQYDPVAEVDAALSQLNADKGWQVGIHVDSASGGFVAPFQPQVPAWDFRLPNVLSISASGHKFGLSVCGTGWVVWRQREGLSEHVATSVSYLGGHGESYTLNFSRPASGVYVQAYKFLRLGREGYSLSVANQMATAEYIRAELEKMEAPDGRPRFKILDAAARTGGACLPVVTAMLNPDLDLPYDDVDLQHVVSERHWYVSGYHMHYEEPLTGAELPLFRDAPPGQSMFRVVVKNNLSSQMAVDLVNSIKATVEFLDAAGEGYAALHRKKTNRPEDGTPARVGRHTC